MGGKGNIFYVYEHWRPDRNECFYVGKGTGKRANSKMWAQRRAAKALETQE